MTKTRTPLLSMGAHGSIGGALTYQKRGDSSLIRKKPIPTDPKSDLQLDHRLFYRGVCYLWQSLSLSEKQAYLTAARRHRITGFNLFMRRELSRLLHPYVLLPFAAGSGNTLFDYSENSNNATIFGAVWKPGDYKPYLYFDGLNDRGLFSKCFADLGMTNTGNLEVKITPIITGVHSLVNDYETVPVIGMALRINADRTLTFYGANVGFVFNIFTTFTLSDNITYVIRAELTGTRANLYIDGVLQASGAQIGAIGVSPLMCGIGYYPRTSTQWFKGDYHYLVIYPYL